MNGIETPNKERVELLLEIFTVMCITLLYVKHSRNDQPPKSIFCYQNLRHFLRKNTAPRHAELPPNVSK